jgi:hypothetical protein
MTECLSRLRQGCSARNAGMLVLALQHAIPDYSPSEHILARVQLAHRAAR